MVLPKIFGLAGEPWGYLDDLRQETVAAFHLFDVGIEGQTEIGQALGYAFQPVCGGRRARQNLFEVGHLLGEDAPPVGGPAQPIMPSRGIAVAHPPNYVHDAGREGKGR